MVCENRKPLEAIQVAYDLSNPKTRKREIEGAVAAAKALGLRKAKILTYSETDEVRHSSGIVLDVLPTPEWATISLSADA